MCGIVGYIGHNQAAPILLEGLRRLEYRGYDSAGLAIQTPDGLKIVRSVGKISSLCQLLNSSPVPGTFGIGHTRWATHGRPSENNAHPHLVNGLAVVHNGIIENYVELKAHLIQQGRTFSSETDTEVIAHLIDYELRSASEAGVADPAAPFTSGSSSDGLVSDSSATFPGSSSSAASTAPETTRATSVSESGAAGTPAASPSPPTSPDLLAAVRRALARVEGTYAIAVISQAHPDHFVVAKNFSPLIIGLGQDENFVASDIPALLPFTRRIITLKEFEIARIYRDRVELFDLRTGQPITSPPQTVALSLQSAEKAGHKHFMHKEIFETPKIFTDTFLGRIKRNPPRIVFDDCRLPDPSRLTRILIIACGTSYHAGLVGRHYFEEIAAIPTTVEYASEFRYRRTVLLPGDLAIFISQSGETADTLAALKEIRSRGLQTIAICNVMDSSIARAAEQVIYTRAGIEIGVASTKAFTAQVEVLLLLALHFASQKALLSPADLSRFVDQIYRLPLLLEKQLAEEDSIKQLAARFVHCHDFIYMGRGINYPIALEGALKLKEISYIHAEGYPAGEMKHGPIALIDEQVPVMALANRGSQLKKIISNLLEAKARGGIIVGLISRGDSETRSLLDHALEIEDVDEYFQPFVNTLPLQLFAYFVADLKGTDVDQPRNLAKSVTVE
ncbi:MAG: glutamine--fructose-6-phosphate transaminase (isomerizing) [Candidatus Saccharicenans sp.]|nr:glutamine--fructose-6-phosphate transaminase (isomerizing) [Candidatus Saccharicenans sp.]